MFWAPYNRRPCARISCVVSTIWRIEEEKNIIFVHYLNCFLLHIVQYQCMRYNIWCCIHGLSKDAHEILFRKATLRQNLEFSLFICIGNLILTFEMNSWQFIIYEYKIHDYFPILPFQFGNICFRTPFVN